MTGTIRHRGPDDEGAYFSGPVGLGFRRLSILDVSPKGHQPMGDRSGRVWVVFNGEIYNFLELRKELEAYGAQFHSHCDTEVIVQGYLRWGEQILNRLNGMFGLAIWDDRNRRLIVARDAMGIKPVYYSDRSGTLYFASEIRAISAALDERPQVDALAANLFLRYRYTPAPLTMFRGIQKLAPGEMISVQDGTVTCFRWYQFRPQPFRRMPAAPEATEALLELYKRAVKRHLISDVPVGLLLSGGIDSGLLLGLMNLYGSDWPTFTVGYGAGFKDDELSDAAETARLYCAPNARVELSRADFERALPHIVSVLEEPVASSSIVPMYFVAQRARQDVKVALIGQGPDELFGGYKRHLGVRYGGTYRIVPWWLRSTITAAIGLLPRNEGLKRAAHSLGAPERLDRYEKVFSLLPSGQVDALFHPDVLTDDATAVVRRCWTPVAELMEPLDELSGFQLLELRSSLPDELLMYGDKLSMAHSLEVRVPYLDREIVEYVQCLNSTFKVRNGRRKWLHRQVSRRFLPPAILRRKKRGFAVNVVDDWFRKSMNGRISEYLYEPKSLIFSLVQPDRVAALLSQHASGHADHHKILFSLVVLEQWMREMAVCAPVRMPPAVLSEPVLPTQTGLVNYQ